MFQEAELLKKHGHEVYYFCTDKKPYYDENYEFIEYFPKYIDFKKLSFKDKLFNFYRPFYNPEAVKKFGKLLDIINPDIVHDHTITFHLTSAILLECYKRKIPVITTIHSFEMIIEKNNKDKREINLKLCFEICKKIIMNLNKLMGHYKNILYFIFPSKALAERGLLKKFPKEKMVVIHNFIEFGNYEMPKEKTGKYFLYSGRLVKEKGVYDLIEAWKTLPENIELHIAGTGEEEFNLRRIINKYNLDNVKLLGFKEKEELQNEYKGCIATILPSLWLEAFGMTILESFCYGKPVIASNIGGIPEIVKNSETGFLVEPGNIKELKESVLKLYKDSVLSGKMGISGRKTAERTFAPQFHYNKLVNLYEKAINQFREVNNK